jgi:hypothetical protein
MARPFRKPRKVKEPPVPVVYEVSPEIGIVQSRLVRLNPIQFGWSNNFKIGAVLVRGGKPKDEGGCVILARFVKVPPLYHGLTGYDAIIRVEDWAWNRLDSTGQEALVAHELCHGSMSDKGALRVMRHDLDEFGFVVRKYGAWREAIALFDRQLAMFEPGLGRTPTEGDQAEAFDAPTPIESKRRAKSVPVDDEADVRPAGDVNTDALRGEVDRAVKPDDDQPR